MHIKGRDQASGAGEEGGAPVERVEAQRVRRGVGLGALVDERVRGQDALCGEGGDQPDREVARGCQVEA